MPRWLRISSLVELLVGELRLGLAASLRTTVVLVFSISSANAWACSANQDGQSEGAADRHSRQACQREMRNETIRGRRPCVASVSG
jgi:hypothetical protein